MKTKVLFFLFVFFSLGLRSQVNAPDTTTYVYCDVMTSTKVMSNLQDSYNVNVFIDFGKGKVITPDNPLIDENGGKLTFTSTADVLNYLSKNKWVLVCSSEVASKGNWNFERIVIHFILKKKKY